MGYWVGVAENCGDALTYNILTADTLKIIPRSLVRPANESLKTNLRIDPTAGEIDQKPILFIKDRNDSATEPMGFKPMLGFDPADLIGRTFLQPQEDGEEVYRARVLRKIIDNSEEQVHDRVKFMIRLEGQDIDEIITYNQ